MLKKLRNSLLCTTMLVAVVGCVDQRGNDSSNISIAATSVAVTEILDALEVPAKQVIGIPESQSYTVPKRYKNATTLGSAMTPDMEVVSSLKPSLILSPNSLENELKDQYKKLNINSAFLNLKSVAGMYKSIEELGSLLGKEKEAKTLVDEFVSYMVTYRKEHENSTSPRILILMGLPGSYVVASESSYVGDLVKLAGGTNVYGDGNGDDFLNVNPEDMLQQNPDIILRTSHALPDQVKVMFAQEFAQNDIWSKFKAVQNANVYDLDSTYFGMSANMKYPKALTQLEELLYGSN